MFLEFLVTIFILKRFQDLTYINTNIHKNMSVVSYFVSHSDHVVA